MKFIFDHVFLQYPGAGEALSSTSPSHRVHRSDDEMFVAIDSHSGGYPYGVPINRAHDFKTVEAAEKYRMSFDKLRVREVRVTYDFQHEED